MRQLVVWFTTVALLFTISGCSTETKNISSKTETTFPTTMETEPPVIILDNLEYWDIVQDEIVSMLKRHNLYVTSTTHTIRETYILYDAEVSTKFRCIS